MFERPCIGALPANRSWTIVRPPPCIVSGLALPCLLALQKTWAHESLRPRIITPSYITCVIFHSRLCWISSYSTGNLAMVTERWKNQVTHRKTCVFPQFNQSLSPSSCIWFRKEVFTLVFLARNELVFLSTFLSSFVSRSAFLNSLPQLKIPLAWCNDFGNGTLGRANDSDGLVVLAVGLIVDCNVC